MLVEAIKNRLIIHKYFFGKIFSFNHINYYYFMNHIYNTLNYLDFLFLQYPVVVFLSRVYKCPIAMALLSLGTRKGLIRMEMITNEGKE